MNLLIISDMSHYSKDGRIFGWGPTVQEINHLATLFHQIRHIGFFYNQPPPASSLPYESNSIHFIPVKPTGGKHWYDKLNILRMAPKYIATIRSELKNADVVHLRCPANITLIALLYLSVVRNPKKRWFKYAGNWKPDRKEAFSYTLQRWLLRRGYHRGVVTVNGSWPGDPDFVHSFPNPSLTHDELNSAKEITINKKLSDPLQLMYAGRLDEEKGVGRCLEIVSSLRKQNVPVRFEIVGDGPRRKYFETKAESLGINDLVHFHGWLPRPKLPELYAKGHIFLFPSSSSEGWPKVLSESMAYGMVSVASRISSIPQILANIGAGQALDPFDIQGFVDAIVDFREHPDKWELHSRNGIKSASLFSYENYLKRVSDILALNPGVHENSKNEIAAVQPG
jgi:glycosyltransferase involved in cell wall biosynthesis